MARLRLAIVMPDVRGGRGVEAYALRLATEMVHKFEVHVFAAHAEGLPEMVRLHRIWAVPKPYSLRLLSFAVLGATRFREHASYLVNVQGFNSLDADVATLHGCLQAYIDSCKRLGIFERIRKKLNPFNYVALYIERRLLSSNLYTIVCVSQAVSREICRIYGWPKERTVVIPPGIDPDRFRIEAQPTSRMEVRMRLGLQDGDFILLFVGNEFHRKGLDALLEAMRLVCDRRVRLLVVGQPNRVARLEYRWLVRRKGLTDRVLFAGRQSRMEAIYAAADVFVFPSLYEAFPAVALEAAASGLPLLATRVGGVEELLVDGHNGWFVERSGADIAEKINRLAADQELVRTMGENARASVAPYDWKIIRQRLIAVYERIAAEKRARHSLPSEG